jgi:hypothetical protein
MRQSIVPDTHSATVPSFEVNNDGVNYWVRLDDDPNDPRGCSLKIYSFDIDATIEALQKAKMIMYRAGAQMQVEY